MQMYYEYLHLKLMIEKLCGGESFLGRLITQLGMTNFCPEDDVLGYRSFSINQVRSYRSSFMIWTTGKCFKKY